MKKNGFRVNFINLRKYPNINWMVGARLFIAGLLLAVMNNPVTAFILAACIMLFPSWNFVKGIAPVGAGKPNLKRKFELNKKGLTGDNLTLITDIENRVEEMDLTEDVQEQVLLSVKTIFADIYNTEGKVTLDFKKLNELLGEDDKGIKMILKKQGEEISALKEMKGKLNTKSFKEQLDEKMVDIEKLYKEGKGKNQSMTLDIKAAANMSLTNTITGDDTLPDALIESFSVGAFVPKRYPREYVFDIANRTTVSEIAQFKTWLEEGSEQGAFAIVTEGAVKPLVSYSLVRNSSTAQKVAAKYVVTEEFTKWRKEAYSIIQRLIQQKILRDYAAILTTDLLADAAAYTASALDGQYDLPTDFHAIAAVAAQIEGLNFMPDLLIMNPQDKWRIGMSQNTQGSFFLQIPMQSPTGGTVMMGFNVRTSNRVAAGNFILGEAGLWEIEDEAITVRVGYGIDVTGSSPVTAVSSDFDNNRFRVIVETFFHDYIASNNAGSFVYANFNTVKAALQSA